MKNRDKTEILKLLCVGFEMSTLASSGGRNKNDTVQNDSNTNC